MGCTTGYIKDRYQRFEPELAKELLHAEFLISSNLKKGKFIPYGDYQLLSAKGSKIRATQEGIIRSTNEQFGLPVLSIVNTKSGRHLRINVNIDLLVPGYRDSIAKKNAVKTLNDIEQTPEDFRPDGFYKNDFALRDQELKNINEANLTPLETLIKNKSIVASKLFIENKQIVDSKEEQNIYLKDIKSNLSNEDAEKLFDQKDRSTDDNERLAKYFATSFVNKLLSKDIYGRLNISRLDTISKIKPKVVITDSNGGFNPFYSHANSVIVGIHQIQQLIESNQYNDFKSFDNVIENVAQEEAIHLLAEYIINGKEDIDNIYSELSDEDIQKVKDIYNKQDLSKANIVHEYIRMVVQNKIFGTTTEIEIKKLGEYTDSFLKKLINQIVEFVNQIFGQKTTKTLEDIINFTNNNISKELADKIKNREFSDFVLESNITPENNNLSKTQESELSTKIKDFLSSIGVSIAIMDKIVDSEGKPLSVVAKSNILAGIIEVVEGRADISTLPEEASHFFLELLGKDNSMYQRMMRQITEYQIYQDVLREYDALYRNKDGTIDFEKMKKEAIAKLITKIIIEKSAGKEDTKNIKHFDTWWDRAWKWIQDLFTNRKGNNNPFMESADRILNNDTKGLKKISSLTEDSEMFQTTNPFDKLTSDQSLITLDNSIDPKTGEKRHDYLREGVPVKGSVTGLVVQKWYKNKFPGDRREEVQKKIDSLSAIYGDNVHVDMQSIINSMTDPVTHELLASPSVVTDIKNNPVVFDKLKGFIAELISQYGPETKFLSEFKIYDPKADMAGSVDLIVLLADGSADIYDWKSLQTNPNEDELKWFKEPAFRIQLGEYKRILKEYYGIKVFNKVRAIPIRTIYSVKRVDGVYIPQNLSDIEIGSANPQDTPEDKLYLLPIVGQEDTSGDKLLDKLITKLHGLYRVLADERVTVEQRDKRNDELRVLRTAIRDLQVRNDLKNFINSGVAEIDKYSSRSLIKSMSLEDIADAKKAVEIYEYSLPFLTKQLSILKENIEIEKDEEKKKEMIDLQNEYLKMTGNANALSNMLTERSYEILDQTGLEHGVKNLHKQEKPISFSTKHFRSLSQIPIASLRLFYKIKAEAEGIRDGEIEETNDHLRALKTKLLEWGTKNGISNHDLFNKMLDYDEKGNWTGDFVKVYDPSFREKFNTAIQHGDSKWVSDNTVFNSEAYDAALKAKKEYFNSRTFNTTDLEVREDKKRKAIDNWIDLHSEKSENSLLNSRNWFRSPKAEYQSKEWKELNKPENTPVLEAYNYFQGMLKKSNLLGMMDYRASFVPSVLKSHIDKISRGELKNLFSVSGAFDKFAVDNNPKFPEIDPRDGSIRMKIPTHFTNDLGIENLDGTFDYSKKSNDLFKVFSIWGNHTANYEAQSNIQATADALVDLERVKGSKIVNMFGDVKPGEEFNPSNIQNFGTLEKFVKMYVYGQKMDEIDFKVRIGDKTYSLGQGFRGMLSYLSFKTLAVNPLSGTSTFVGGTGNALMLASKGLFFTTKEWLSAWKQYTGADEKTKAVFHYLNAQLEDEKYLESGKLSIDPLVRNLREEHFYYLMKKGDRMVQEPIALTLFNNHMILNGKIVAIADVVKANNNYEETFYDLSIPEQKKMKDKMDKEIVELKKTHSLYNISEMKDGKLVIPGINKKSIELTNFKNKIKKMSKTVIGNATQDDINLIRTSLLGGALMQFRSWMPQMAFERVGQLNYDIDTETYSYGKTRLFLKHLMTKNFLPLIKELTLGLGTNTIQRAKERYVEFQKRMEDEGQDFDMTETQFIDMYLGNIHSQVREMQVMCGFLTMYFATKSGPGDDPNGLRKYLTRAFNKYQNEFTFYYSPSEFQAMMKNPLPVTSLLRDVESTIQNTIGQIWNFAAGDEEAMKNYVPMKYLGKMIPVIKEAINTRAIFDDDFRKEWQLQK